MKRRSFASELRAVPAAERLFYWPRRTVVYFLAGDEEFFTRDAASFCLRPPSSRRNLHTLRKTKKIVLGTPCAALFLCYIILHIEETFRKIVKFRVV